MEPQAPGEWFHCKVLNVLTSFLWSIRVQTMLLQKKKQKTITFTVWTSISVEVSRKIAHTRKRQTNCAIMTSFSWSVLLSNTQLSINQRARNSVKNILTLCLKYAQLSLSPTRQQKHQTRLFLSQYRKSQNDETFRNQKDSKYPFNEQAIGCWIETP